jgi:hypothetical protein
VLVPAQPSRYVQDVERVVTTVSGFLILPLDAVPLLVDEEEERPVAAMVPYGEGRFILVAAPALAMNKSLQVSDNAQFWLSLMTTVSRSGPVAFDEFHHGFTSERSLGEFASRYRLHFAIGQLAFGVVLWALSLKRFGRPRPPMAEFQTASTEALWAMARVYREGQHYAHASAVMLKHFTRELANHLGLSHHLEPHQVAAALMERGRKDGAAALREVMDAVSHAKSERDVQKVAMLTALARRTLYPTWNMPR